jgi:cyanophycinase
MFTGGDQSKIVDCIGGTKFHSILAERYHNEHFVIAGTSAGAMAMSQEMIAGGSITDSLFKGAVKLRGGMGLNSRLIIDSHFIKRGRFGRLTEAVAAFPDLIGIGLAEDTGVVLKDDSFTVIGSGMVIVFDGSQLTHNKRSQMKDKLPLSMAGLIVHVLADGDCYDTRSRTVSILPLEEFEKA